MPANVVLKCFDWAIAQREAGNCIISGFHSKLEKDVLYYLLKGTQPIIIALARGLKEKLEPELKKPMEGNRLLVITPFDKKIKRVTVETAKLRNQLMIDLADETVIGYPSGGGMVDDLINDNLNKKITRLCDP